MPQDVEINPVCKKKPFVLPHTVSLFWKYDQLSYTHFNFNFRKINYKCWNENKAEKSANTGNIIEINLNLHQMKNILFINDKASMYFCTTVMRKNYTWSGIGFANCGTRIKKIYFTGSLKISAFDPFVVHKCDDQVFKLLCEMVPPLNFVTTWAQYLSEVRGKKGEKKDICIQICIYPLHS